MQRTKSTSNLLASWAFLIIAIIAEVLGSSFLKVAQDSPHSFLITVVCIALSYYFIGLAIKQISISLAYAVWEVFGVICIACVGIVVFDEVLNTLQFFGIFSAIVGIVLINMGECIESNHTQCTQTYILSSLAVVSVLFLLVALGGFILSDFIAFGTFFKGMILVAISALLDVIANILLKLSNGFSRLWFGVSAIGIVIWAFYFLMLALDFMGLAVAYSSWGAMGIMGTILGGWMFFGERLRWVGFVGVGFVLVAVVFLHIH